MANGQISPALPFAKKEAVEILKASYRSQDEAALKIPQAFAAYYKQNHAAIAQQNEAEIASSAKAVLAIYQRNVFPEMNVKWGSYPNNLGHNDFPGCWRCHDSNHTAKSGETITQDCNACHNTLASDEPNPKVLTELGITEPTAR
jgi:cytochrome c2